MVNLWVRRAHRFLQVFHRHFAASTAHRYFICEINILYLEVLSFIFSSDIDYHIFNTYVSMYVWRMYVCTSMCVCLCVRAWVCGGCVGVFGGRMYMHAYKHVYMHVCTVYNSLWWRIQHTNVQNQTHTDTKAGTSTYTHTYTLSLVKESNTCTHAHTHVHMHAHTRTHTHIKSCMMELTTSWQASSVGFCRAERYFCRTRGRNRGESISAIVSAISAGEKWQKSSKPDKIVLD